MTKKKILHELINGFCPYASCGVPVVLWELAENLVLEIYGEKGAALFDSIHKTYETSTGTTELHSIDWIDIENEDFNNPTDQLIAALEKI